MYPPPGVVIPVIASGLPPPQVTMKLKDGTDSNIPDPLSSNKQYHTAKLRCNRRITSPDWYQDVRHIEFSFDDEIRYDSSPHPSSVEVIRIVTTQGTSQSSIQRFHPGTSTHFYQRWAGQTLQISCIPSIFHSKVCRMDSANVAIFTDFQTKHFPIISHPLPH